MTFVLVHGGGFDHRCWDPLVPRLDGDGVRRRPAGSGRHPAAVRQDRDDDAEPDWTIADFAESVVDVIEAKDLTDVVLVGHSLAGITLPVVAALVPDRIRRLVFVSASVPPQGSSVADVLELPEPGGRRDRSPDRRRGGHRGRRAPPDLALAMFCNDMTDDAGRLHPRTHGSRDATPW